MNIRPATLSDAAGVSAIYNEYTGKATLDLIQRPEEYFRAMIAALDEREAMLIVEPDGIIAGYGLLKKYSWKEGYQFAGETSVFIKSEYRQKGFGNLLKRALIEKAKELNYKHLVARILAKNTVSINYNLKLGYEWVGVQKQIGFVDDEWLDVAILQLVLK